jgi:hypothetical protein
MAKVRPSASAGKPVGVSTPAVPEVRDVRRSLSVGATASAKEIHAKLDEYRRQYPDLQTSGSTPRATGTDNVDELRADLALCEATIEFENTFQNSMNFGPRK